MLIGILSDTHGRAEMTSLAVRLLCERGAQYLVHCGDVGSPDVLSYLAGMPAAMVWGNCDYDRPSLVRFADLLKIQCFGSSGQLVLDGKRIAVMHGDDAILKKRLLDEQQHDYLFQGHTHVARDERIGRTRLINPGALHRANPRTVALLDIAIDRVEFLEVG